MLSKIIIVWEISNFLEEYASFIFMVDMSEAGMGIFESPLT